MADDLILNWNLTPENSTPFDLILDHTAPLGVEVASVIADYSYRYATDADDAPWQSLGSGVIGQDLAIPINLVPGDIIVKGVPRTSTGQVANRGTDAAAAQITYTVPAARPAGVDGVTATEDLTAGNSGFVNLYNSSGLKVRKANATDNTKPCDGYILDNIANAATGTVYKTRGDVIPGLSGLTDGAIYWLSTTGGQITTTPDRSASGRVIQSIGQAMSATELLFDPQPPITVA